MLGRGLANSKNIGLLIGGFTLFGNLAIILMDELGGYLFDIDAIYPFMYIAFPANVVFAVVVIVANIF